MNNESYTGHKPIPVKLVNKTIKSIPGGAVGVIINKDCCRTEVYIDTGEQETNKKIFDKLYSKKDEIEKEIPGLTWERKDEKKGCRIRLDKTYIYLNENDKDKLFKFFCEYSEKMMKVFNDEGNKLNLKKK